MYLFFGWYRTISNCRTFGVTWRIPWKRSWAIWSGGHPWAKPTAWGFTWAAHFAAKKMGTGPSSSFYALSGTQSGRAGQFLENPKGAWSALHAGSPDDVGRYGGKMEALGRALAREGRNTLISLCIRPIHRPGFCRYVICISFSRWRWCVKFRWRTGMCFPLPIWTWTDHGVVFPWLLSAGSSRAWARLHSTQGRYYFFIRWRRARSGVAVADTPTVPSGSVSLALIHIQSKG
jgi:hypothetical protein